MDREWIDDLLSRVDLVQLISRYVPLKRKGATYWGCCPFHHEKEPSFAVTPEKRFYHCFGCKESGNAITFIQKMEMVDFIDAVKRLAEEVHMELPKFTDFYKKETVTRDKRDRLYALNREAARHYHENLSSPSAKAANEYLQRREIPNAMIKRFGLGVSLGWTEMIEFLESKGYTRQEMKEAGIAEQKADRWYDVFSGRLIYPIINNFGEVVAFGGRTLETGTEFAKYRNTTQTPIFDKSKTVYAINLLKKKKQTTGLDSVIMCEGYMDVISLHKAGFDNAVASMGTALTIEQAKLLKNYGSKIYISYDGDTAGQKATMRGLDILDSVGLNVKVVSLPEGMDPDDVVKKNGADFYRELLDQAVTLPAFKISSLKKKYDLTQPDEKAKYAVEAVAVVKALRNPVEREEYLKLVHETTGYSMDTLKQQAGVMPDEREEVAAPKTSTPQEKEGSKESAVAKRTRAARLFVVASLVHQKPYVDLSLKEEVFSYLDTESSRDAYQYVVDRIKSGEYKSPSGLLTFMEGDKEIAEIVNYEFIEGDGEVKYKKCLNILKAESLNVDRKRLLHLVDTNTDTENRAAYLVEIAKMDAELRKLK